MTEDTDLLRDITDAYHLCATLGLIGHHAAVVSDGSGTLLALIALAFGHRRPAATLTLTSTATAVASALLH